MSPVPLCLEKWGVMTPQLLWERRPSKIQFIVADDHADTPRISKIFTGVGQCSKQTLTVKVCR